MIISLVNSKGGVGKSTLAGNLAGWLAKHGRSVILADCDTQQSSSEWITEALPDLQIVRLANADAVLDELPSLAQEADFVIADGPGSQPPVDPQSLERELVKRGIGPASAEELSLSQPSHRIREMLELHDWYNGRGQPRGPGFLVQSIRNPASIAMPPGFESTLHVKKRQQAREAQKSAESNVRTKRERLAVRRQNSKQRAFMAFWEAMSPSEQDAFETEALENADGMKRRLYLEASGKGGKAFEIYRQLILSDHFERTHGLLPAPVSTADGPSKT